MKKVILLIIILGLAAGVWYLNKIQKEKAIFEGKTKMQILKLLRDKWKAEYFKTKTNWITNHQTAEERERTEEKAAENGVSFSEQVQRDVTWLWANHPEDKHPYRASETDEGKKWWKRWTIAEVEAMGVDTSLQDVQDMMYKI